MIKNSVILSLLLSVFYLRAAETSPTNSPAGNTNAPAEHKPPVATIPDASHKPVLATNTVTIDGQSVTYQTETGMLPVLKPDGTSRASVFYIAYTRLSDTPESERPVTFCFNGGPGSSSVWLHLGALGPRRVKMNEDGTLPKPPFSMMDNPYSLLDASDLVFIDPVATGFSRPAQDQKAEDFFGETADVESIGGFIRLWTTRRGRWLSPKYLCGESYGVFRAAGLAEHLRGRYGLYLNGLILVSGVLNFSTLDSDVGNDLPYVLFLPNFTSTAHFHKKLPSDLQSNLAKALAEARDFGRTQYASALHLGSSLPADERKKIVTELARLTGLKPQVIEDNNLRIDSSVFRKQLLHDQGLILGAYDGRITGRDDHPEETEPGFDPSYSATYGPFSAAINYYAREELKFEDDLPYEIIAGVQPWTYVNKNSFPHVSDQLASAMSQNPYSIRIDDLHVATPAGSVMLSEPHLDLKPGEHVLIAGEQSEGTCLFRATAGLWPWGSGRITFPARQSVVFRPTRPYARTGEQNAYTGEFYPGPHRFDVPMQEPAFVWLQHHL